MNTSPSSTEAEQIVAKLTEAQREVLAALPREYGRWWAPIGWLLSKGLIEAGASRPPKGKSYDRAIWHATPLGLQVRALLTQQDQP